MVFCPSKPPLFGKQTSSEQDVLAAVKYIDSR